LSRGRFRRRLRRRRGRGGGNLLTFSFLFLSRSCWGLSFFCVLGSGLVGGADDGWIPGVYVAKDLGGVMSKYRTGWGLDWVGVYGLRSLLIFDESGINSGLVCGCEGTVAAV
jgi:hypothetical protein